MADDIEGGQVVPEVLHLQYRDGKQQAVILSSVKGRGHGVYVKFLAKLEGIALERNLVCINLCPQAGVAHKLLHGIGQSPVYQVRCRRHNLQLFHLRQDGRLNLRLQV